MPFYSFRNLVAGFAITITIVLLILLYTFSTHLSEEKELGNIQISREALQKLEPALVNMQEFEYGLNSFVNSGGEQQSSFYTAGSVKLQNDSLRLTEIANSDSNKQNATDYRRLAILLHQMKNYAAFILHLYEINGTEAAKTELKKGSYLPIVSDFKTLIEKLETNSREILSSSYNRSITLARKTFIFTGIISGLLILILIISFLVIYKDIRNRFSYNEKLVKEINKKTTEINNVFERVTDAFIALDKDWRYIYVNQRAAVMHDRKAEDLIGKNIWTEFPDVINEPFYNALHEAMEKQEPQRLQLYYSTTDRWFEDLIYPSQDGVSVYYHDITETKRGEIKLAKSEEKYRTIIEQASDGIFIADKNSFIIDANNYGCSMLGYSKEDLLKMKFTELISPENIRKDPVRYDELGSGNTVRNERKLLRKDGSEILVDISAKILSDGRFQSIVRDITDRKKAEEYLQRSNNRFELITRTTNDAVWEWNLETGELWANEMHQHLYGLAPSDPVPTVGAWTEKIHPDDRLEILKRQEESLASDKNVFISEYRFNVEGKGYRDIYDRCYIVRNREGKPIRMMGSMMDITERKKAQQQIEKEKILSYSIINSLPGVFYLFDKKRKYIRWNKNKEIYTGYTDEEISNMSPVDFFEGEEKNLINQTIEEGFTKGKLAVEAHLVHKNGKRIPFYFTGTVVEYEGKPCLLGMGIDITERKKAEEKLRESEERYRSLIEQASDAIMITDQKGNFIDVNSSMCSLFSYTKDELLQKNVSAVIDPEQLKTDPIQFDVILSGRSMLRERRMMRKDGTIVEVEANVKQLPDGRILAIARDISERKKAEQAIRTSEETRRLIMNSALDAIVCMDTAGIITVWTPQAEKIFGWKGQEVIGKHLSETIIPIQYREKHKQGLQHYLKTREGPVINRLIEITALNKKGEEFPVELSITSIRQEGIEFFCGFLRDITERKKAQNELEQSYNAIRHLTDHLQHIREEERIHIAREIHDELGQQLTVMKMDLSWLNKKMLPDDELVKQKLKGLAEMLDGTVKTVRRISSELRPSLLDDMGLIAAMEWQLKEFEERSGIKTSLSAPGMEKQLPDSVKTGLFRIFQESLTNVARHADAKKVKVNLQHTGSKIVLSIEDDGKGYDKKKTAGKRTLGILGMRERTLMMGGEYEIKSSPGKGTTVLVAIPEQD
jgi:PAS domain S-box-containing protein